jgi:thiamine kinase-like enzyme
MLPLYIDKYINDNKLTKITELRVPDRGLRRSFVILCDDKNLKQYCLKVFDSKDKKAKERFINEAKQTILIKKFLPRKYKSWIPTIVFSDLEAERPYFITRYVKGQNLSTFLSDYGVDRGMFKLANFKQFIKFFSEIQSLHSEKSFEGISSWGGRNIRKELNYYLPVVKNVFSDQTYDNIMQFLDASNMNLYKDLYVTSHRDLYPENVIIEKRFSNKITFLDWEYFSLVPIGYDAAFLFLLFWREEFWKAKTYAFFENMYRKDPKNHEAFINTFKTCVVILGIRFIYQIKRFGSKEGNEYEHFIRTIIYDIENTINGVTNAPRNIKFYLNENDLNVIAREFKLGVLNDYEVFYSSKGNAVARVQVGKKNYIFRFYGDSRPVDLIMRELRIFKKLKENGISTYGTYKNKKGKVLHKVELYGRIRRVAVLSFLEGKKIQKEWADKKSAFNLGTCLRSIHNCGIIHGDFSKENVLFNRNIVCGVIDFEWGKFTKTKNMKLHDLAKALALWITDIRYKKIEDADFFISVIRGYYGISNLKLSSDLQASSELTEELFEKIKKICIEKINREKEIYFTTLDHMNSKPVTRFERSVEAVSRLKLYNKP